MILAGSGTGIVSLTLGALRSGQVAHGDGCIFTTDLGKKDRVHLLFQKNALSQLRMKAKLVDKTT